MKRNTLLRAVLVMGLLAAIVSLVGRNPWVGRKLCGAVEAQLAAATPLHLRLGTCQVEPFSLGVALSDVELRTAESEVPVFAADLISVRLRLLQLIWGKVGVDRLEVGRPRVHLDLRHLPESPARQPEPASSECMVGEVLHRLEVGRVQLEEGEATVLLPNDVEIGLSRLSFHARTLSGATELRIGQEGGHVTLPSGTVPLDRLIVSASLDGRDREAPRLELERVELAAGRVQLRAGGVVRKLCAPEFALEASLGVPLDLISQLAAQPSLELDGFVAADLSLGGTLAAPKAHAEIELADLEVDFAGQNLAPGDLSLSVDVDKDKLTLQQLTWPFPHGEARIKGELGLGGDFPLTASARVVNVGFGEIMNRLPVKHPWVDARCGLDLNVAGKLLPTPSFGGPAVVDVDDLHVRTRAWDAPAQPGDEVIGVSRSRAELDFHFEPEKIRLTHTRWASERIDIRADLTLFTDPERGLDIDAMVEKLDLDELGPIAGLEWHGKGSAALKITGPYGRQTIDGALDLADASFTLVHLGDVKGNLHFDPTMVLRFDDFWARMGRTSYGGKGSLDFSQFPIHGGGTVAIKPGGRVEDVLEVLRDVHWSFDAFRGQLTGGVTGTLSKEMGPILAPRSVIALDFEDVKLWQRPLGKSHFVMLTEDGDSMRIPPLTFQGGAGTWRFGGRQEVGGELDYTLDFEDVPVAVATAPELTDWQLGGALRGQVRITGPQQEARIDGDVFGRGLSMFGFPVGQGHVQLHGVGDAMSITGPVGDDVVLWSRMAFRGAYPTQATLTFQVDDLAPYLSTRESLRGWGGSLRGSLALSGLMRDSSQWRGEYLFPQFTLTRGDHVEEAVEPVRLGFARDRYELRSLVLRGRTGERASTELSFKGTREGPRNALALHLDGSFDAHLLELLWPWMKDVGGRVEVSAAIAGTQDAPTVVGALQLSRGKLTLRDLPISMEGLDGRIEFSQSSVEIPRLTGTMNRGRVDMGGTLQLQNFSPRRYDLHLSMDESHLQWGGWPDTTLSGALAWTGPADDPVVSGDISVVRFRYDEDLKLERLLTDLGRKKLDARTFTKRPHVARFSDLHIHLDGDVRLDNNLVKTAFKGSLEVLGDDARPNLRGEVENLPGGLGFFRGNEYAIDRLRIAFRDTEKITPEFDLKATTQAREYRVFLHAYGTADEPVVRLTSQPELPEGDLLTLVTLGFTSQDRGANNAGTAGIGAAAEALYALSGLDGQVQRFIPKTRLLQDPSFRFTTTYSQSLGSMQPTAQIEGKVLTDRFRLRLQEPMTLGGRGFRMQGEYRFGEAASLQGALDRDNSDYNFPDVGLDLKLRMEIR